MQTNSGIQNSHGSPSTALFCGWRWAVASCKIQVAGSVQPVRGAQASGAMSMFTGESAAQASQPARLLSGWSKARLPHRQLCVKRLGGFFHPDRGPRPRTRSLAMCGAATSPHRAGIGPGPACKPQRPLPSGPTRLTICRAGGPAAAQLRRSSGRGNRAGQAPRGPAVSESEPRALPPPYASSVCAANRQSAHPPQS